MLNRAYKIMLCKKVLHVSIFVPQYALISDIIKKQEYNIVVDNSNFLNFANTGNILKVAAKYKNSVYVMCMYTVQSGNQNLLLSCANLV